MFVVLQLRVHPSSFKKAMAVPPDDDFELAWRLQREEQLAFQREQERQRGGGSGGARAAAAGDGQGRRGDMLMAYVQQLESAMETGERAVACTGWVILAPLFAKRRLGARS